MRIGIEIKAFKNGSTGIARYLRNIMDRLQKLDETNDYFLFECSPSGYPVRSTRWKKILLPWRMPGIFWQQFLLPGTLKKFELDVLWSPEQICPIFHQGPIFTTVHDLAALRFPHSCQKSNYLIQKHLFPATIRRSTLLLPVSDFVGSELLALYPKLVDSGRIRTIANGSPDWNRCANDSSAGDEPFLFFAGNAEPRKNLSRLIDALELLHDRGIRIALHIAGPPGWKNRDLHAKIASSKVRDSIRFLGFLSEGDLREQYRTCTAVVYPSVYEGFGLPILEALSTGARVITSRGTVMEQIAGTAATYFDPFDSRDIAATIAGSLEAPLTSQPKQEDVNRILDTYSWEKSARTLLESFTSLAVPNRKFPPRVIRP